MTIPAPLPIGLQSPLLAVQQSQLPIADALVIPRLLNAVGAAHQASQTSGGIGSESPLVTHGIGAYVNNHV